MLTLYSCSPSDLILAYYDQRYLDQRFLSTTSTYPIGSITLRALVDRTHLRIEVLNARHLKPAHIQRRQYGDDIMTPSFKAGGGGGDALSTFSRNNTLRRSYACGVTSSSTASSNFTLPPPQRALITDAIHLRTYSEGPVSYTHLTLPTICSV